MTVEELEKRRQLYNSIVGDATSKEDILEARRVAYNNFNEKTKSFDYGKSLTDDYNSFMSSDGYKSPDEFNTYKKRYAELKSQAQQIKDYAEFFGGNADYIKSLDDFISSTNDVNSSIDSVASHYSQFKDKADYDNQINQYKSNTNKTDALKKYNNRAELDADIKNAESNYNDALKKYRSTLTPLELKSMDEKSEKDITYNFKNSSEGKLAQIQKQHLDSLKQVQQYADDNKYFEQKNDSAFALKAKAGIKALTDLQKVSSTLDDEKEANERKAERDKLKYAEQLLPNYQYKKGGDETHLNEYATDEEIANLGYIYKTQGAEEAEKYAVKLQERINAEIGLRKSKELLGDGGFLNKAGAIAYEGLSAIGKNVGEFAQGFSDFTKENPTARPTSAKEYEMSEVRNQLGDAGRLGYDLAVNTGNMIPSIVLSAVNPIVGSAEMFVSSGGSAMQQALREGATPDQAKMYGLLNGASETALQKVLGGIPQLAGAGNVVDNITQNLLSKTSNVLKRAVISLGGHTAGEFTEEYLQEVLDPVFKNLTYKDGEEVKLFSEEALYAGILGALSAGAFSGVGIMSEAKHQLDLGKGLKETNFIETAKAISQNAELPKTLTNEINKLDVNTGNGRVGGIAQNLTNYLQKNAETKLADALGEKYTVADAQDIINSQYGIVSNNLVKNITSDSHYAEVANAFGQGEFGGKEIQAIENVMQQWVVSGRNSTKTNPVVDAMTKNNQEQIIQTVEQNNKEMTERIKTDALPYDALTQQEKNLTDATSNKGINLYIHDDLGEGVNGYYANGEIHLSRKAKNPAAEVFKHELTHYAQKGDFDGFEKYAKKSKVFNSWINTLKSKDGKQISGISEAIKDIMDRRGNISSEDARAEVFAYFVQDNLVNGDIDSVTDFLNDIKNSNRNLFERIVEQIKEILQSVRDYFPRSEKGEIKRLETLFEKAVASVENANGEKQNSYAGDLSKTADLSLLQQAKQLDEQGADSEEIRQKTGWFKGYDGMWRYEIDDKDITVDFTGKNSRNPDLKRYNELEYKFLMGEISNDENSELQTLSKNLEGVNKTPTKLGDIVSHTKLFEAYPDLADIDVRVEYAPNLNIQAGYSPSFNEIVVNRKYMLNKSKLKKVLIHEIQHAIQTIENFASGSSPRRSGSYDNYINTAGEIEARDIANRIDMTAEQRKNTRPDIDRSDVVFADEKQYSKQNDLEYLELAKEPEKNEARLREMVDDVAKESGWNIRAYHGTGRADRVGNVFLPSRATSGPMAFFTDNEEIAKNYARDKRDTSISYDEEYTDYYTQFRVNYNGKSITVSDLWYKLSPSEKAIIKDKAKHITFDDEYEEIIYNPDVDYGLGNFDDYTINYNKGNYLKALTQSWLEDGNLFGEEERFLDVLKLAGLTNEVEYRNPDAKIEKVYNVYLKIQNPFDTYKEVDEKFVNNFLKWANENDSEKYHKKSNGSDSWDKNDVSAEKFAEKMRYDIEEGRTLAWTSIPDVATDYLKSLGYDGIKDAGGKSGGELHTVWIPFESNQIKSADLVTYDDNGNIIPLSERFNSDNDDIRYSMDDDVEYDKKVEKYGAIEQGENPIFNNTPVPKQTNDNTKVRRATRTILEGGKLTDDMVDEIKLETLKGAYDYEVYSDKSALAKAQKLVEDGSAMSEWEHAYRHGKVNKDTITLGALLIKLAVDNGNTKDVLELSAEYDELMTIAGQSLQSGRMLKKLNSSYADLIYVTKYVDRINRSIEEKNQGKPKDKQIDKVTINPDSAEVLLKSKSGKGREKAKTQIMSEIASQMPTTIADKFTAWRYLAMLGNPRTHIRNIVGNAIFTPAIKTKNVIGSLIEKLIPQEQRTKSAVVNKNYKNFATEVFEKYNVASWLSNGGKYNSESEIDQYKKVFKNAILEGARKINFDLLEKEDAFFLRSHFISSLGGFMQARGVDISKISLNDKITDADIAKIPHLAEGIAYAGNEALKATFRDASAIADALTQLSKKNKALNLVVEGVIPFKKTPINILKRGIEYSPFGLIKAGVETVKYARNHESVSVSQIIDSVSAGMTGTGIFLLGMAMKSLGFIELGFGDDDKDKFAKLNGEQEYSIKFGDVSFTIDWAAPSVLPFFVGGQVASLFEDEDNSEYTTVTDAMLSIIDPILNLSMLSGLNDVFESVGYSQGSGLVDASITALTSFATQSLPTLGGQVSRLIDNTRRSNYIDKNSDVPVTIQRLWNTVSGKVPGLSYTKDAYIDAWGREKKTSFAQRLLENSVSPGYFDKSDNTALNNEIIRLYDALGENSVFPKAPKKKFKVDGEDKNLTSEEYNRYAKIVGSKNLDELEKLISNSEYNTLSDSQKLTAFEWIYKYSTAIGQYEVANKQLDKAIEQAKELESANVPIYEQAIAYALQKDVSKKDDKIKTIKSSDLSSHAKELLAKVKEMQNTKDADEKIKNYLQSK